MKKLVCTILTVIALGVLSASPVSADTVYNANDAIFTDPIPFHAALVTGGSSTTIYFSVNPEDDDGENGCNLVNSGELAVSLTSTTAGVASLDQSTYTFTDCSDTMVVEVSPIASGTATFVLTPTSNTTGGSFNFAPATLLVSVTDVADTTAPTITPIYSSSPTASGWNNSNVTVTWDIEDTESPIVFTHNCGPTNFTSETDWTQTGCTAISAGGQTDQTTDVKIDKTKPVITGSFSAAGPAHNGWYNSQAQAFFSCSEAGLVQSQIDVDTVSGDFFEPDGANQSITNSGSCTDLAGNIANSATVSGINMDNTAPEITVNLPAVNGLYDFRTTDLTDWEATDSTSGVDLSTATPLSGELLPAGSSGSQYYVVTVKDYAGNEGYISVPYTVDEPDYENIDWTGPSITPILSAAPNANGWHKANLTVNWDVEDLESTVSGMINCGETLISTEGESIAVTCSASSSNGYETSSETVFINLDKTLPFIGGMSMDFPNSNGWYNDDVDVMFSCQEQGTVMSGIITDTVQGGVISTEGTNQSINSSGSCIDLAGNAATPGTVSGIKLDKTAPSIVINNPVENAHYVLNSTVLADWAVTDLLSGVDEISPSAASGSAIFTTSAGTAMFTVAATDLAGNQGSLDINYVIDP